MRFTSHRCSNAVSCLGGFVLAVGAILSADSAASARTNATLVLKYQTGPGTCAENIFGTPGNDRLDGSKSSCDENIVGYGGHDILIGGKGTNILNGGKGRDRLSGGQGPATFVYSRAGDSTVDDPDIIKGFKQEGNPPDRIDLSGLGERAHVKLSFIGDSEFTGQAGEVSYRIAELWECKPKSGWCGDVYITVVQADLTGDRSPDFQIDLNGFYLLTKDNFILRRTQKANA